MDPQRVRRPREPRGDRVPPPAQRGRLPRASRTRRRSPRSRPRGRWCRGRRTSAGSASASSGTWAGCTTRCSTCDATRSTASTTTTSSRSGRSTRTRENFVLPLSHDEVVHGKGSLLGEDARRRLAAVRQPAAAVRLPCGRSRARSCCSWAASSASASEWNHDASLDWHLLDEPRHAGIHALGARPERAVPRRAGAARAGRGPRRVRVDRRVGRRGRHAVLPPARADGRATSVVVALNLTPVPHERFRIGLPDGRRLARAPEQRRRDLRRVRHGEPRARRGGAVALARAPAQRADRASPACLRVPPARHRPAWRGSDLVTIRVWPGPPVPAGRHVGRRGRELLALLRARDGRRPLPVRPAGRRRGGRAHPAHQPDRPPLARLPPRRPARAASTAIASTGRTSRARVTGSTRTSSSSIRTRGRSAGRSGGTTPCTATRSAIPTRTSRSTSATAPARCRSAW